MEQCASTHQRAQSGDEEWRAPVRRMTWQSTPWADPLLVSTVVAATLAVFGLLYVLLVRHDRRVTVFAAVMIGTAVWTVPALTVVLAATNGRHGLVRRETATALAPDGGYVVLAGTPGPWMAVLGVPSPSSQWLCCWAWRSPSPGTGGSHDVRCRVAVNPGRATPSRRSRCRAPRQPAVRPRRRLSESHQG